MKNLLFLILLLIAVTFLSCSKGSDTTVIAGRVIDNTSGSPIKNAVVEVTQPEDISQSAVTDSAGHFSFDVNPDEETVTLSLEISKQGYQTATSSFKLVPGNNVDDLTIRMSSDDSSSTGDGGDNVGGEAGGPASMELINLSSEKINVAGTGGDVNASFTFEVTDSAGRVVDSPVDVKFQIIKGPGGGETIQPEVATTGVNSPQGSVRSNLAAGDSSGVVRIEAVIERPDYGITIRSSPVIISISSGFPVAKNFNIAPNVHNFDAYGIISESHTNTITASVGDIKGNPVKEGTAVYFSAPTGGLVNGSAVTNENGYASVNLSANGSQPTGHPMGPGFIDIIGETIDKDNNWVRDTTTILLITPRADISVSPQTLNISNGGSQTFDVAIADENGNPMAADTKISVTTGQGLTASGDIIDLELGDYFQPGPGTTEFGVTISDQNPNEDNPTEGSFTIKVVSPLGETTTKTIQGSRAKSN